jgi:hypothetical protein
MLTAYLDESGHETNDAVVVAGFLGNDEQWVQCAERWRAALRPRTRLHMKNLRGWKKDRIRRHLERLGPIPHECGLTALLAMLRVSDYYDLVAGTDAERMTKGYYFCLMTIFDSLVKNTPKDQAIKLVFEDQKEYEIRSRYLFRANAHHRTTSGEHKFNSIEHIPKDSSILTEPADYLAFAKLQQHRDPQSRKSQWCTPILRNTRPAFGFLHDGIGLRKVIQSSLRKMPDFAKPTRQRAAK